MSTFGEYLIQSLQEAAAHAQGNRPAIVHTPVTRRARFGSKSISHRRKWRR